MSSLALCSRTDIPATDIKTFLPIPILFYALLSMYKVSDPMLKLELSLLYKTSSVPPFLFSFIVPHIRLYLTSFPLHIRAL
jgi:hypothetical protein